MSPSEYESSDSSVHYYARRVMLWGSSTGNSSKALSVSVTLAVCFILVWMVISSLPLAYGGSESERRQKVYKMQTSASFNFVSVFLSQLVFVWLISTLLRPSGCIDSVEGPIVSTAVEDTVSCGYGGSFSWSFRLALPLLAYFCLTCTLLHTHGDAQSSAPDFLESIRRNEASYVAAKFVTYDQFYSHFLQAMQVIVCLTSATGLASSNKFVPLVIISVSCLFMAVLPVVFFRYSCSLSPVVGLRAACSLLVLWTSIVTIFKNRSEEHSWVGGRALIIGWLCIGIVSGGLVFWVEHVRRQRWVSTFRASSLPETVNSLVQLTSALTIDEALMDGPSDKNDRVTREAQMLNQLETANSFRGVCEAVIALERKILAEKLTEAFLVRRAEWRENLTYWNLISEESIHEVQRLIAELKAGIRRMNPLALVSRNVLSITFKRKCPEEIAWEIYDYLHDSKNVRAALDSIMKSNQLSVLTISDSMYSYRYKFTAESMVWKNFDSIRRQLKLINLTVVHDNTLYGKSKVVSNRRLHQPRSVSSDQPDEEFTAVYDTFQARELSPQELQIIMDHELAQQLEAEGTSEHY